MPTYQPNNEDDESRNSPYRSVRRTARKQTPRRGKPRRLSVRSEVRDEPDLRKLAQAVLKIAMDEAAAERAHREAESPDDPEVSS